LTPSFFLFFIIKDEV